MALSLCNSKGLSTHASRVDKPLATAIVGSTCTGQYTRHVIQQATLPGIADPLPGRARGERGLGKCLVQSCSAADQMGRGGQLVCD